jgi:hypothetical protein
MPAPLTLESLQKLLASCVARIAGRALNADRVTSA